MSWKVEELGEVCQIINGRNQKYVISENGSYPIFGSGGNVMGYATKFLCEENTVIIGRKGNISNPILIKQKFWNVDTAFGIYPFIEKMLPLFNYYQCLNIDFASYNKGTTIPSLVKSDLLKIQISYPKSLSEQQAIVEKLDAAFALIDQAKANIEKNIQNAKELFQSKLNQIFSQKGEGWEERKLGEVCENLDSKRIPITKNRRSSGEIPYYGASGIVDFVDNYIFDGDYLLVSEDGANLIMRTYPIAFSVSGKIWVNNHAHILKFNNINTQKYFEYYLNSIKLDDYISGMAQPKLNQAKLNLISIPLPTSLETQQQIVLQLDALSQQTNLLQEKYRQKLQNLEELRKSILEKAFKGELVQMSESQISSD